MNARAPHPNRTEPSTVPPPHDAADAYSAPTRAGTLPEELLAAMREQEMALGHVHGKRLPRPSPPPLSRPKSGTRPIAVTPLPAAARPAGARVTGAASMDPEPMTVTLEELPPTSSTLVPPAMFSAPAPIESPASAPPFAPVRVIDLAPASNLDGYLVDAPEFRSSVGPRIVLVVAFALLGAIVAALILFT